MKISNEPIDSVILKALQTIKKQETLGNKYQFMKERSVFAGLVVEEHIQEIIQWQETFDSWEEISEINTLVSNLSSGDPDFAQANNWLIENRDEMTPEKLHTIIYTAWLYGKSEFAKNRHKVNWAKDEKTRELWKDCKAKDMNKHKAKKEVAKAVGLSPSTSRDKLRNL